MSNENLQNTEVGLFGVTNVVGTVLQLNYPNQGDVTNAVCPDDLRSVTWPEGKRVDLTWTNPTGVTRIVIKRSQTGHSAFLQDDTEVIYNGAPIEHFIDGIPLTTTIGHPNRVEAPPELEVGVPNTGVDLEEDTFFYYTIYMTSADVPIGVLDFGGGEALGRCQVTGLSITDYRNDGSTSNYARDYFYRAFDAATRDMDQFQAQAEGRTTGYHEDFSRFLQATFNLFRGYVKGLMKLADPGKSPAGLVGETFDQASILKGWVRLFNIPPERYVLDVNVLRRLATDMTFNYKEKGTCEGVQDFVKTVTLWDSTCTNVGDQAQGFFLETWDGTSAADAFSYPASLLAISAGQLILPAGILTPNLYDGGLFIDSVGDVFVIEENGTDVIAFSNGAAVVSPEDLITITLVAGAVLDISPLDGHLINDGEYDGLQLLDSTNVSRTVLSTDGTTQQVTVDSVGTTAGAGSIAPVFTLGASFAARDPQVIFRLWYGGKHSFLWEPLKDLALTGDLSLLFTGGSLLKLPFDDDDVIVEIAAGVAAHVGEVDTLTVLGNGNIQVEDTSANFGPPDTLKGFYLNVNEDQTRTWRIVGNTQTKVDVELDNPSISPLNVAEAGTNYFVLDTPRTRRYEQLVRLLPRMLPTSTRGFIRFL